MAKSTPQTKPNLFGTLTQKPASEKKNVKKAATRETAPKKDPVAAPVISTPEIKPAVAKLQEEVTPVSFTHEEEKSVNPAPVQSSPETEVPFSNREGINHASLLLTKTNLKFLRIRTRQLGTTLQKYVDLLLREEKERWNEKPGYPDTIYDYCENRFKEEKKVMSLITSKEGNEFLNNGSIEAGIKKVTFMNYIISREIEREANGMKRQSMN